MQQIGRYQILERLGRGAMGVVYRALDPRIGRAVAVKSIRLGEISDTSELKRLRDRLEREARSAGALSHPNIVTVYDILEEEKLVHLFMEYVNGPSLEAMLSDRKLPEKPKLIAFFRQIASALDYAHRVGIVHRDVKPSNLMLHFDRGTGEQVAKVTDFGVAKFISQQLTQAGLMMGTPNYMAPEQIEGSNVTGQTDQFALAAVTYEVLTGSKPFVADYLPTLFFRIVRETPAAANDVNPTLSSTMDRVLQKGMAKAAEQRYESCSAFVAALADACANHSEWAPPYRLGVIEPPAFDDEPEPLPVANAARNAFAADGAARTVAQPVPETRAWDRAETTAAPPHQTAPHQTPPILPIPAEMPQAAPHKPTLPPPAPPLVSEDVPPLDRLRPARKREWAEDSWAQDEPPAEGLPLWRKITIAVIVCAMAGIGFVVYRNYYTSGETLGRATAASEQPATKPFEDKRYTANPAPARTVPETAAGTKENADAATHGREASNQRPRVDAATQAPAPGVPPTGPDGAAGVRPRPSQNFQTDVQFTSEPSRARVVVDKDEAKSCETPCAVKLTAGRHTLTVSAENYGMARRIIQVPDQKDIFVPLSQNIGIVQVDSMPQGSSVFVDGRLLGQTPTTLKLMAGPHQIRLVNGSRSHQESVEVSADSLQQFTFRWQ